MNGTNSIALIIIAGVIFFLFGKPILTEVSVLNDTKSGYEKAIEDVKNVEEKKNQLLAKIDSVLPEDKEKINTFLPDSPEIVDLVSEIDALGAKYGISISDIDVGQAIEPIGTGEEIPEAKYYASAYLSFSFKSNYEKLKLLISDIESSLRIMDIRSIDINGGEKGIYDYKVTAEIYWLPKQ